MPEPTPSAPPTIPPRRQGLLHDFVEFLVHEKAWWLTPIVVVLALAVAFILFGESSPIMPAIYAGLF